MKFNILSNPSNLKTVRQNIKSFIQENKLNTLDELNIVLAVDEAVQNIIRHAYSMNISQAIDFDLSCSKLDLTIVIRDYGAQVPLEQIKSRDLKDVKPGGLGVHFIHSICKEVSYQHKEQGTLLTLKF